MTEASEKAIEKLTKVHKPKINERLARALEDERKYFPVDHPVFHEQIDVLYDFNLRGGKRLRPAFIVEGYSAVGGKDLEAAYDASLIIEGSEAWLLIHDDIIDNDTLRRGKPTVHVMYNESLKRNTHLDDATRAHLAEGLAIVAGDLQNILNYDWIINSNFDTSTKISAIKKYNEVVKLTSYGQVLDILSETKPIDDVTEEDVILIHSLKTSTYTIWGPLQIGGVLGGAREDQLKAFYDYGHPIGVAFQLQDDIIGMYGDPKKSGKPAHSDLKEGKRTLLIIKALENATPEQRKQLLGVLGNRNLTDEDADIAREIVKETGALDYNREMALKLINQGLKAVEDADITEESKEYLIGIADFLIHRDV